MENPGYIFAFSKLTILGHGATKWLRLVIPTDGKAELRMKSPLTGPRPLAHDS